MGLTGKLVVKMLNKQHQNIEHLDEKQNLLDGVIRASVNSPERLEPPPPHLKIDASKNFMTPSFVLKYGHKIRPKIMSIAKNLNESYSSVYKNPTEPSKEISAAFLKELEDTARSLGVTHIGYTKITPELIFRDKSVLFENVIVYTMEMPKELVDKAPHPESMIMYQDIYAKLGEVMTLITDSLRNAGYGAQAGHPCNGLSNYVGLAHNAGIGWLGKHRMLITPEYGTRQRIAVVYTSIDNLPFHQGENPHEWIEDFCNKCKKCIRNCPTQAIIEQTDMNTGNSTFIEPKNCYKSFLSNYACGICVKQCTFSNTDYAIIKKSFMP